MSDRFFSLAQVVADLGDAAKTHSPVTLERAATMIDNLPSSLARGSAYLGWLLARVPNDERDEDAERNASYVLAELNAVIAVLIDLQTDADCLSLATRHTDTEGGAA